MMAWMELLREIFQGEKIIWNSDQYNTNTNSEGSGFQSDKDKNL